MIYYGYQGNNNVSTHLGVIFASKNKIEVELAMPTAKMDIYAASEDIMLVLSTTK